jgi:hypothetical protein
MRVRLRVYSCKECKRVYEDLDFILKSKGLGFGLTHSVLSSCTGIFYIIRIKGTLGVDVGRVLPNHVKSSCYQLLYIAFYYFSQVCLKQFYPRFRWCGCARQVVITSGIRASRCFG